MKLHGRKKCPSNSTSSAVNIRKLICVGVAAHKSYPMPSDAMYQPIQVGKSIRPNVDLGAQFIADNSGDNISGKNAYYSELTAVYWLWKNCKVKYKGIVHYRRYFATRNILKRLFSRNRFNRIATTADILPLFKDGSNLTGVDIILPKKRNYYIETIYSHYSHTFSGEQLDEVRKIIAHDQPKYLRAFDSVMKSKTAHMFNMFIMRGECFDEYCAWLFPILAKLMKDIDPTQYDAFNARYPGRISEMLLDVWILTNKKSYVELPVTSPEPVNWWAKGTSFLMAKFIGKKYFNSF